jgi:outer membrane receptor protein involved in Fe transport
MGKWEPLQPNSQRVYRGIGNKLLCVAALFTAAACAQTTQGLIAGRLTDSQTGRAVAGAGIEYESLATGISGVSRSDPSGYYYLPLLSPGLYRVRAAADGYQAQEVHELELPVAARLDLSFRLRPLSDVWEAGQYRSVFLPGSKTIVTFYGPDVDTSRSGSFEAQRGRRGALESTVSQVIDAAQLRELPLAGRDAYTMLVTQPGVTADAATARGLGLSINGMRPSASNFMLDGLENNHYLVTGPLTPIAPEVLQEYRVSINNFSAAYGRTAGFLANAVTRPGTREFHGVGYWHLKNEALNANGFQENLLGLPRPPVKERQLGFHLGGPAVFDRLFFSTAYEHLRSRSRQDVFTFKLPSTRFLEDFTAPTSLARSLLERFPPPPVTDGNQPTAPYTVAPPVSLDRSLAIERLDYSTPGGAHRFSGRAAIAGLSRPDFIWSPYPDFISALRQDSLSIAGAWLASVSPALLNEAKIGYATDDLGWNRPHPEIPTLDSADETTLPGSSAFYEYRNRTRSWELLDNVVWNHGRHTATFGGSFLTRSIDGFLTAGRDAQYGFPNIIFFALDRPSTMRAALARETLPALKLPAFDRGYRGRQYALFAQDTFRFSPRLTLNYGLRYERYGAPRNTGAVKDAQVVLGGGQDLLSKLPGAALTFPSAGDQDLLVTDTNDFAVRFGASYDPSGAGRTLLRGAFGVFYDRPFDNLWQNLRNNNFTLPLLLLRAPRTDYLRPVSEVLASLNIVPPESDFPKLTMFDPAFRNGYAQSYFAGVQQRLRQNWSLEVNALGTLGRKLITTDIINRQFTTPDDQGRPNPLLPDIAYRAGQGSSSYHALTAVARYGAGGRQFQLAYTWSHTLDNQSEPLAGDFFDLSFTRVTAGDGRSARAAFSRQFDSSGDRGNSDFDQRHNLVFFSIWEAPRLFRGRPIAGALFRDWRVSQLAAFRTGFPYTARAISLANPGEGQIINNRADILDPGRTEPEAPIAVPGGQRLLIPAGFGEPAPSRVGNSGRNAFRGPGLYNVDVSVSRAFPLPWLGEAARMTLRADAFNLLNHANLNNPDALLGSPTFGIASYGRQGRQSGFPAVSPFNETARQIQLMLRLEF